MGWMGNFMGFVRFSCGILFDNLLQLANWKITAFHRSIIGQQWSISLPSSIIELKGGLCIAKFDSRRVRGYTPKIWPDMEKYLHFWILEFPLIMCIVIYIQGRSPNCKWEFWLALSHHTHCMRVQDTHTHLSRAVLLCLLFYVILLCIYRCNIRYIYIYILRFPKMGVPPNHSC